MPMPRCAGLKRSATVPPELVMTETPNAPAKKRRIRNDCMLSETATPTLKAVMTPKVMAYRGWRPYISLSGAHRMGPTAKPMMNREMPRTMIWLLTLNSACSWAVLPLVAVVQKEMTSVAMPMRKVRSHFFTGAKVIGLNAS